MALVALYNASDGDNWFNNANWLQAGQDVSSWHGITISGDRVTAIDLSSDGASSWGNNLNGEIPPEIGDLDALTSLNLRGNSGLNGTGIPPQLWTVNQLDFLDLGFCEFGGELAPEVGNLTNVTILNLEGNQFFGSIPTEIGSMSSVTNLFIGENDFEGGIPVEISNLTTLQELSIRICNLDGSIPPELAQLTNLNLLDLANNNLSGGIPVELGSMTQLTELRLSSNTLDGSIPVELGQLANLTWLELSSNNLGGDIPIEIGNLSNLIYLGLWGNQLSGSIPIELGSLSNLQGLYLWGNQLGGDIPAEIGNLTNLMDLDLRLNQLSGNIPSELSQLANLTSLQLARNQLTGSIPTGIGSLTNLFKLSLGNNQLSGEIPTELGSLTNLTNLGLSNNGLTGAVPTSFQNLVNLDRLNLSNNQLEDLPDLTAIANITFFNVSNNLLDFADLEPNVGLGGFDYSNQNPGVAPPDTLNVAVGENLVMDATTPGASNVYAWRKDGQLLENETNATLQINPFALEDGGQYQAFVTNTLVPGLTITSKLFKVNPGPPSAAPTGLTATFENEGVTLAWTDNSYNEKTWEIQRNLFGSFVVVAEISFDTLNTTPAVSASIPAPGNGSMTFRIAAVNDSGKSPFSNDASVDVGVLKPRIQSISVSCPDINVTIRDGNLQSNPATGGATQFIVQRSLDSLTGYSTLGTVTSTENLGRPVYKDGTASDNTSYYYRVAAQTGDGNTTTDFSDPVLFDFGTCADPGPNPLESASIWNVMPVTSTQVLLQLGGNPNYNVGDQVIIERAVTSVGNFVQVVSVELTQQMLASNSGTFTYLDDGLTVGTSYDYRAFTQNATETTDPGDVWTITTEATNFEILDLSSLGKIFDTQGVSWSDYDLDGYEDVFISTFISSGEENLKNVLLRNDGGTDLVDVSSLTGIDDGVLGRTGNWGDYNNDGLIDLFVADANSTFGDLLYFNNGDVTFRKSEPQFFTEFTNAIRGHMTGSAADVDNDGDLDIATVGVFTKKDFIKIYKNNGDETFTQEVLSDRVDWGWSGVWGDYDNDNDMDLFVGTNSTANYLFENVNGQLTINETSVVANDVFNSRGSSWADYDNDGDLDLYVAGSFGFSNRLYRNDGPAGFVSTQGIGLDAAGGTRAIVWQDFDNDGDLDLFTAQAGNIFFFHNDGDGTFTQELGTIPRNFGFVTGSSSGDFNNDGKRDLLITSTGGGASPLLYINKHNNGNNYLDAKLIGTVSNAAAIGAKVRIRIGSTWQMRQVVNLTGANGQNSLITHFGLGAASVVDSLVVEWPSGQITSMNDVSGNQLLTIVEDPPPAPNTAPVAVSLTTPFTYNENDEIELQAFDAEGDLLEYQITLAPENGTLTAVNSGDSLFTFSPDPGLAVNQSYDDSLKFVVTEAGGGLSSNEAVMLFNFFVSDGPHDIDSLTFVQSTGQFVLSWDDMTLNESYTIELSYFDQTDPANTVEKTLVSGDFLTSSLTVVGDSLTFTHTANATDDPYLFGSGNVIIANVTVTSPSGQSSTDVFAIDTSVSGRIAASEDGLFFVFGGKSSVPENESVNLKLVAVETGDFTLDNSTVEIISLPVNGTVGTPVLVKETTSVYIWDLTYTSTSDKGGLDSVQFQINHSHRQIQDVAWTSVEIVEVNDPPVIAEVSDQIMLEDGSLDVVLDISDPDNEITVEIENSEDDFVTTEMDGDVLSIDASGDFFGEVAVNVIVDDGVFSTLENFVLNVQPVNDAPVITSPGETFTVLEDNRLNIPVFADDKEQNSALISFSANSNDQTIASASFDRNLLAVDPVPNANGSVEIVIFADDGTGTSTAISDPVSFTVDFTAVNDAPVVTNELPIQNLVEGQSDITIDLSQHFDDPETPESLTYSVSGNSGLTASISGSVATIGITSGFSGAEILNFEASDGELSGFMQTSFLVSALSSDITVANPLSDLMLNEDFAQQVIDISNVFSATDPLTFSITGGSLADISVNSSDELVINSLQDVSGLEEILLVATDQTASQFVSFNLDIAAVNDDPTVSDLEFIIAENTENDFALGKVVASDVDSESISFAITGGDPNNAFSIDAGTGEITVNTQSELNFETNPTFTLTITVSDSDGGTADGTVTVALVDVDETPTINTESLSVAELSDVGTVVGTVTATNPISNPLIYDIVAGDPGNVFAINSSSGVITVNTASLDFEDIQLFSLSVTVSNTDATATSTVAIEVTDVNESPVATDQTFSVRENSELDTFVGLISGDDPEDDILTFEITAGNDGSTFELEESLGILTVKDASLLDFETTQSFVLTISVSDGDLSASAEVTVNVTNANEVPVIEEQSFTIKEDVGLGASVGTIAASDVDGDDLTYSVLEGNDTGAFEVNASSGAITIADASQIDFDTTPKFELTVEVTDGSLAVSELITVNVEQVLGLEDEVFANLSIYPVPAVHELSISFELEGTTNNLQITLVDLSGKLISNLFEGEWIGHFNKTFSLKDVRDTGIYLIRIQTDEEIDVRTVLINK